MASCGPPPPRAAATPAAAATAAAAAARAATPGAAAIHAAATRSIEKNNASTTSDILAAGSHATAARVLIPGSTSTHMKVNVVAFFSQKMSSVSRSYTGGSVRGTNQGKNVMMPASPRRQGESSVHPQPYQRFDRANAQRMSLYYTPGTICQECIVRT